MNYQALAQILGAQGRYGDTELVHVTPREKRMLRESGGSGTTNPFTGLDEYFEGEAASMGAVVDNNQDSSGLSDAPSGTDPSAGYGGYSIGVDDTGTSVIGGGLAPLGPDVEVGPSGYATGPDVGVAAPAGSIAAPGVNDALPSFFDAFSSRLGALYGHTPTNLALGVASTVAGPFGALASHGGRVGLAGIQAIRDTQGLPEPAPTPTIDISQFAGGGQTDLSEALPQYMGMSTSPSTSMAIPNANTTPASQTYKGLEPYMRDLLRRQGIFI
jgi:hypothetical protein